MFMISQELEGMAVPLQELVTHPGNPRRGSIETIKQSLERFGQVRPIVVHEGDGVILAGNHTFLAAAELGWDKIAVVMVDLPEDEATAYMLMDNRSGDLATWDDVGLAEVLADMQAKDMLDATGFTLDDLEDLQAALDQIQTTEVVEFEGDYTETPEETAARWTERNEGANREIVMLLPHDDYAVFMQAVHDMQSMYEETSQTRMIFRAVTEHRDFLAGMERHG
jgi:ParB-like chromosome segregation protein Spo0J